MALIDRPLVAPDRKIAGFKPLKALRHFRKLVEDKEDTEQVFHIIEALKGKKSVRHGWEFIQSEEGQRFLRDETNIPAMLDNHDNWAHLPENSVGRHYVAFMKREGLTAAGLVAESHAWAPPESLPQDLTQWYFDRLRDTHDLFHVLTGYGRDALGEASLLGFTYSQNHNMGVLFIAYAAARQIGKTTGTKAPLFAAIREGQRLGKAAKKLAHQDIRALMHQDIDEARRQLNLGKPVIYKQCLETLANEGFTEDSIGLAEAQAA